MVMRVDTNKQDNSAQTISTAVTSGTKTFLTDRVADLQLMKVKDESDDEERTAKCQHTKVSMDGEAWPKYHDKARVLMWCQNEDTNVEHIIQLLDSTLMQGNMRGWTQMQAFLRNYGENYRFYWMSTKSSGQKGFVMVCNNCDMCLSCQWNSKALAWDAPELEQCRLPLREFMGVGRDADGRRQQDMRWQRNYCFDYTASRT